MMLDIGFSFEFHSYNAMTTAVLLGIIPVVYVLSIWWKAKNTIVLSVMLGPLLAIEYILSCFWFIATFPFWIGFQIASLAGTGSFLTGGVWLLHGVLYIIFGVSFFLVPKWIHKALEGFIEMYQASQNMDSVQIPTEIKRRPYYAKVDEPKASDKPESQSAES